MTRRFTTLTVLAGLVAVLLVYAPSALASTAGGVGGGQGWYGQTTDKSITNAMFLVILFFPAVIVVLSLIQGRLDQRKHAKMDAAKRRATNADWRGGW